MVHLALHSALSHELKPRVYLDSHLISQRPDAPEKGNETPFTIHKYKTLEPQGSFLDSRSVSKPET